MMLMLKKKKKYYTNIRFLCNIYSKKFNNFSTIMHFYFQIKKSNVLSSISIPIHVNNKIDSHQISPRAKVGL